MATCQATRAQHRLYFWLWPQCPCSAAYHESTQEVANCAAGQTRVNIRNPLLGCLGRVTVFAKQTCPRTGTGRRRTPKRRGHCRAAAAGQGLEVLAAEEPDAVTGDLHLPSSTIRHEVPQHGCLAFEFCASQGPNEAHPLPKSQRLRTVSRARRAGANCVSFFRKWDGHCSTGAFQC